MGCVLYCHNVNADGEVEVRSTHTHDDDMADLVTLVVQSKKALQQAEAVCSGTNNVAKQSTSLIVDILATEAKVKWLSDGVAEQLQVCKAIGLKPSTLRPEI